MAAKLKNLKITKVDFVDEGANPDANIVLIKRNDGVPDPEPKKGVLRRMMDWFTKNVEKRGDDTETGPDDKPEGAEEELEKSASSFDEELSRRNLDKITDDMWNLCYALNDSLCSILCDEELDAARKQTAMLESVEEFASTTKEAVTSWADGNPVGLIVKPDESSATNRVADIMVKSLEHALAGMPVHIDSVESETAEPKGEEPDMKIDKSKLTPEEVTALDAIEKKAGIPDESATGGSTAPAPTTGQDPAPVEKAAPDAPVAQTGPLPASDAQENGEDIYKGLPAAIRTELELLKKFRQDTEDSRLREIAGSYGIIGKTAEQLFPVLKSLKATSPEAYDQMIATLNDAKAAVEKSGVFNEIGRTGDGSFTGGGAVKEAESKAAELMKSKAGLTMAQAIDQVLQADPELAKRYETEE